MLTYSDESVDETLLERKARSPFGPFVRSALGVVALLAIFVGVLLVRNWRADSNDGATKAASGARVMPSSPEIEDKYGVRFLGVDVTSGGGMIQVRYQVLDSAKTEAIHSQEATPNVIDVNGVTYDLPGMSGHSHIGPVKKAGVTDYVLLANARGGVKAGSTVTIKIGDLVLHNVPVS